MSVTIKKKVEEKKNCFVPLVFSVTNEFMIYASDEMKI